MTDDLFAAERRARREAAAPLAARMRPRDFGEMVGQAHLLGQGAAFRTVAESGEPPSMILWGPPGSGKTTLARLIADQSEAHFEQLSAVSAGVKDVRQVLAAALQRLDENSGRTVLFLDEIHRFTKAQQDALLPGVEDGTIILIGATTENPFFEVIGPLVSRSTIYRLEALSPGDVATLIQRALDDARGLQGEFTITDSAAEALSERVGGDARLAYNALETAAAIVRARAEATIAVEDIQEALQRRVIRYDKAGDRHYDVISAFIKSIRGSDPDAALYWLHTMLEAGEDPRFIARRMIILASEDVGLADNRALGVTVDAFRALEMVGLPEASFALSHAAVYLAAAPKSNSVTEAIRRTRRLIEDTHSAGVPPHLRSAATAGEQELGLGAGYLYPHDHPGSMVAQQYLPDEAADRIVYRPHRLGEEDELAKRLEAIDRALGKPSRERQET